MVELEKEEKAETLSNIWMGSNLQYKGLKEILDTLKGPTTRSAVEPTATEVKSEWKRLASFMRTQR